MITRTLSEILAWMGPNRGLSLPHGFNPGASFPTPVTEKSHWDAYQWNPPEHSTLADHQTPDLHASPKPTWDELLAAQEAITSAELRGDTDRILQYTVENTRRKITENVAVKVGDRSIHVGEGIDHMTALLQMVEHANEAGARIPKVSLRDENHELKDHWTQSALRDVLQAVTARENAVENAHNKVMADYHRSAKVRDDPEQPIRERLIAASICKILAESYPTDLESEIEAYDPKELPTDLEERKAKQTEHLEADALAHVNMIRGALTRQRLSLPPACDDMANAEKKVAREQMFGQLQIMRADDVAEVDREYKIAKSKIESVKAVKVPEFRPTGGDSRIPSNRITFKLNSLNLSVIQEAIDGLPLGRVAVDSSVDSLSHGDIRFVRKTDNQIDMVLSRHGTHTAIFVVVGRNLCGFNRMTIVLQPPAED